MREKSEQRQSARASASSSSHNSGENYKLRTVTRGERGCERERARGGGV